MVAYLFYIFKNSVKFTLTHGAKMHENQLIENSEFSSIWNLYGNLKI